MRNSTWRLTALGWAFSLLACGTESQNEVDINVGVKAQAVVSASIATLAVLGDSISRAFNAGGDHLYDTKCSWGDDLKYSWFSNTNELGQCYEHEVYSMAERAYCATGATAVANFGWNGADMATDVYDQAVAARSWLVNQPASRFVAILLGGNDICSNQVLRSPGYCPRVGQDPANYCRPSKLTFEQQLRRALDVLVTVPYTHIGVADPPRVSLLCNLQNVSAGSFFKCRDVWRMSTLFGNKGVCQSLLKDCSNLRREDAYRTYRDYRDAIRNAVVAYAAVTPGTMVPYDATFGTGGVTKAVGVSLQRSPAFGRYKFGQGDISRCDCFHPNKGMQNKLAYMFFNNLPCSSMFPCCADTGIDLYDSACVATTASGSYIGLLPTDIVPIGYFDWANSTTAAGWSCDANAYEQPVSIHFYRDGPAGGGGVFVGATTANLVREPAVGALCGGQTAHGFQWAIANVPSGTHTLYAYAIDIGGTNNPLLNNSPKTITR